MANPRAHTCLKPNYIRSGPGRMCETSQHLVVALQPPEIGSKLAVVAALGVSAMAVLVFEIALNATSMFNHGNVALPPAGANLGTGSHGKTERY